MILNELRKNARVSLLEVAKKTNIPLSTLYDKIKNYDKGPIKRHTILIDFPILGYHARKLIALKIAKESRQNIQNYLAKHPNVNSLYRINSGFDYLAEIIANNSMEIQEIVEEIEAQKGILGKKCFDVIDELKKEEFVIK